MSHVDTIELDIQDLNSLARAAEMLGMELVPSATFRWYGRFIGDYEGTLPTGFTTADYGNCEYVLRIKDNDTAYEVGVARRRDGQVGYVLLYDLWLGGYGLEQAIGQRGAQLKQEYALAVAEKELRRKGFRVSREQNAETGKPRMRARRI